MLVDAQSVLQKQKRFWGLFLKHRNVIFVAVTVWAIAVSAGADNNPKTQPAAQPSTAESAVDEESVPTPEPSKAENINLREVVTEPLGEKEQEKKKPSSDTGTAAMPEKASATPVKAPPTPGKTTTQEKTAATPENTAGDSESVSSGAADPTPEVDQNASATPLATEPESTPEAPPRLPLVLLDAEVPPGTSTRLAWTPKMSFMGITAPTAVLVINGVREGPTLCLTGAVHGDELNGIEIIRHVVYNIDPQELSGAVIGVPIVNLQGFRRASRYLPDRRDLNRYFPGNPDGSSASRIAHSFFEEVITHCDMLVDIHTGSFHRTNLPQVRADLAHPDVAEMARGMGAIVVVQSEGHPGSLRRAAVESGVTAITLEAGQPHQLQKSAVNHGIKSLDNLMDSLGMLKRRSFWEIKAEPIYYSSSWVRATQGGILFSDVELGDRVKEGDLLGTVTDPITNARSDITAPADGRVIGMALNQVMYPGFAAYHIGLQATVEDAAEKSGELKSEDNDLSGAVVDSDDPDDFIEPPSDAAGVTIVPASENKDPDNGATPEPLDRFGVLEDSE